MIGDGSIRGVESVIRRVRAASEELTMKMPQKFPKEEAYSKIYLRVKCLMDHQKGQIHPLLRKHILAINYV